MNSIASRTATPAANLRTATLAQAHVRENGQTTVPQAASDTAEPAATTGAAASSTAGQTDRFEHASVKATAAAEPAGPSQNEQTVTAFYDAFARKDGDAMAAMFAPDAKLTHPVLGNLEGRDSAALWQMFCRDSPNMKVELKSVSTGENGEVNAVWHTDYKVGENRVTNDIDVEFRFKDGKIVEHNTDFSFSGWAQKAFGLKDWGFLGRAVSGAGITKTVARHVARRRLRAFVDENG